MEDLADKDNSPLKDSEISRLIGVSNNTGYKKQETIPARNLIDFKPKSLLEIAVKEENIHDNEGKKIEVQSKTNDIQNEIAEENEKSEAAEDSEDKTLELKEPEKVESPENQNLDEEYISKTTSQDLKNQNEEENKGEKTSSIGNLENVNRFLRKILLRPAHACERLNIPIRNKIIHQGSKVANCKSLTIESRAEKEK